MRKGRSSHRALASSSFPNFATRELFLKTLENNSLLANNIQRRRKEPGAVYLTTRLNPDVQAPPRYFLKRLMHVLQLIERYKSGDELNDYGLWLLARAAFATFCTLRDLGCEEQAMAVFRAVVPQYLHERR